MNGIAITIVLIVALLMWRNRLAGSWALRAAAEAHALNLADINAGVFVDLEHRYDLIPSHASMMFDLTRWRYRSPFHIPSQEVSR